VRGIECATFGSLFARIGEVTMIAGNYSSSAHARRILRPAFSITSIGLAKLIRT